ncbi:MAG: carbohydrate binding family 9 domain-containing protein, partial [Gammaproteobacteria bacterium]|nr:carbohydrate binding family 9 domain-containing protein [Gammaproteobacteria bacterium]
MSIVSRRIRLAGPALLGLLALLMALQAAADGLPHADASLPVRKSVPVLRVGEAPVIDGDLGDPVWRQAAGFDDFTQLQPSAGAPPSQRTEVRLLYDANHLYLGIRAYDTEPDRIVANQLVQGRGVTGDDHIQILLDPLDSARRGYVFFVNPNGVQVDGLTSGSNTWNLNWDGIWHARSRIDAEGWTTEIAIPFRTLSFDPGRPDWGMTVVRQVGRSSERQAWTFRDFRASTDALGLITGLRDLEEGRGLDVIPSL